MQYKGVHKPLREIAQELQVDAIMEGTVLRAGHRVRITAQCSQKWPKLLPGRSASN
jgi:TolB-like protein